MNKKFLILISLIVIIFSTSFAAAESLNSDLGGVDERENSSIEDNSSVNIPTEDLNETGNLNETPQEPEIDDNRTNTSFIGEDLIKYYKNDSSFIVQLIDVGGNPISGENITFIINNVSYIRQTNDHGYAAIAINLNSGKYPIAVQYNGSETFKSINETYYITVLSTIQSEDLVLFYRNGSSYIVRVVDSQGNPLAGVNLRFNINGVFYSRVTDSMGQASLKINLNPGVYIITTIGENGEMKSNNVTVLSTILSEDLVLFYQNGSSFVVNLVDGKGKPLSGTLVKFNINGVFYNRVTDENGQASLKINLNPDKYIITTILNSGEMKSNNITILPTLQSEDVNIKVGSKSNFTIRVVDGQGNPINGSAVIFNIEGKFYNTITNENGTATLDIYLTEGKHVITSYANGLSVSNKINVLNVTGDILGVEDYGFATLVGVYGNLSSDIKIGYIVGLHPREYATHDSFLREFLNAENLTYCYYLYKVTVTENPYEYSEGRLNGQLIAYDYIVPDAINKTLDLVIDIHNNQGNWDENQFIFSPNQTDVSADIGKALADDLGFIEYFIPPNPTSHEYVTLPLIQGGVPALTYEDYMYNSDDLMDIHSAMLIEAVDNLDFSKFIQEDV